MILGFGLERVVGEAEAGEICSSTVACWNLHVI